MPQEGRRLSRFAPRFRVPSQGWLDRAPSRFAVARHIPGEVAERRQRSSVRHADPARLTGMKVRRIVS